MTASRDAQTRIERFWQERAARDLERGSRFHSEHTVHDLAVIEHYCAPGKRILDLGAGSCDLLGLLIERHAVEAVAVEKQEAFLRRATPSPRLRTVACDVLEFDSAKKFDIVLLLGVISSIPVAEARCRLYERVAAWMAPGAVFLLKSQFGVAQDVAVDRYSEELEAHYVAHYPAVRDEVRRLEALYRVRRLDPYPPALHRFADTHFYFLVCECR